MKHLTSFLKKLQLKKVIAILAIGFTLFFTVACNNNPQGARPYNPPVQSGGANNPYKGTGDSYTVYRQQTPPNPDTNVK
ncbi:hypothetical protein IQ238_22360 [Pleurocapsales cyanobacterium LEGE 06147]|nr:hypothetical protein [Pleurocapsales cyanobacterium LEGE 06147]